MRQALLSDRFSDRKSWSPLKAKLDAVQERLEEEEIQASQVKEAWERRCKAWHNELSDCSRRAGHIAMLEERSGPRGEHVSRVATLHPPTSASPARHRSVSPVPATSLPLLAMPKRLDGFSQDDDCETSTAEGIDMDGASLGIGIGSRRSLTGASTASCSSLQEIANSLSHTHQQHHHLQQQQQPDHEPQSRLRRSQKLQERDEGRLLMDGVERAVPDERQLLQTLIDALQRGDLALAAHAGCSYASGTQYKSAAVEAAMHSAEERETKLNRLLLDAEAYGQEECEQLRVSRQIIRDMSGKLTDFEQGSAVLESELAASEAHAGSMEAKLVELYEKSVMLEGKLKGIQSESTSSEVFELECRNLRLENEEQLIAQQTTMSAHQVATKTAEQLAAKVALHLDDVKQEAANAILERDAARSALIEVESEYAMIQLQSGSMLKESAERNTQEFRNAEQQLRRSAHSELQAMRSLQESRIQAVNTQLERKTDEAIALHLRLKDEQKVAEDAWNLDQCLREEQIEQQQTISRLQNQLGEEAYALREAAASARTDEARWSTKCTDLEARCSCAREEVQELIADQVHLQSSLDRASRQRSTCQSMLKVMKEEEHSMGHRLQSEMHRARCRFELEVLELQEEKDAAVQLPSFRGVGVSENSSSNELKELRAEVANLRKSAGESVRACERAEGALREKNIALLTLEMEREAESRSPTRQRLSALEALLQTSETTRAHEVGELRAAAVSRERRQRL
eukprot:gnl/MRDRNA2_/MRDRNA2_122851_c0_seq1.p1 gnl/MRDRNA2_/MRDRNA2_122851_c0~~gnl/MRDRNA2_/MRDRNA2_122851_c0_seq1.p1  ORF type:complete len:746 (-),score=187.36 gnl/MRDRNA2_/MRDRNA2_122851_c0_seq1:4-2241(-)